MAVGPGDVRFLKIFLLFFFFPPPHQKKTREKRASFFRGGGAGISLFLNQPKKGKQQAKYIAKKKKKSFLVYAQKPLAFFLPRARFIQKGPPNQRLLSPGGGNFTFNKNGGVIFFFRFPPRELGFFPPPTKFFFPRQGAVGALFFELRFGDGGLGERGGWARNRRRRCFPSKKGGKKKKNPVSAVRVDNGKLRGIYFFPKDTKKAGVTNKKTAPCSAGVVLLGPSRRGAAMGKGEFERGEKAPPPPPQGKKKTFPPGGPPWGKMGLIV